MEIHKDLGQALKHKTILLDTCMLGTIRANIQNPDVQGFVRLFDELDCPLIIHDLIKVEFLRDSNSHKEVVKRNVFIKNLCQSYSLPFDKNIYRTAMIWTYIYVRYQHKGVELMDLMTSALLKKYSKSNTLILVTTNNKDFPLTVHDRIGTLILDLDKDLATLGFYQINLTKWNEKERELVESEEWELE